MIVITDKRPGGFEFSVDTNLCGMVEGDAWVKAGRQVEINGMVTGDLRVSMAARVKIRGTVVGHVLNDGGIVEVWDVVGGVTDTGREKTLVHKDAIVGGRRQS